MSAVPQLVHDVFRSALEDPIECRVVADFVAEVVDFGCEAGGA
jgi:hypothetical protein